MKVDQLDHEPANASAGFAEGGEAGEESDDLFCQPSGGSIKLGLNEIMPVIVAHRGLHQIHPENSFSAFSAAWNAGIHWCECDIHFTADDVPVVIHDATLDRTTNLSGAIIEKNWGEISEALMAGEDRRPQKETLPSLKSVLQLMPASGGLLIEIKPLVPAEVILRNLPRESPQIMLQSFVELNLHQLRDVDCKLPMAFLVDDLETLYHAIDGPWESIHARHSLLTDDVVAKLRRAKKKIGAWTVNDPSEMRRFFDLGIDVLITDFPVLAREVLQ